MEHYLYFLPVVVGFDGFLVQGSPPRVPARGERSPSLKRSSDQLRSTWIFPRKIQIT